MKAMQVRETNGDFVLVERDIPVPAQGQVRSRVEACGVCLRHHVRRRQGTLLLVAAAHDPIEVAACGMLSGRRIQGWPSGSSIDSEYTMRFSALTGVRPRTETFPLEQANEAFAKVMENSVRFRAVLTMPGN